MAEFLTVVSSSTKQIQFTLDHAMRQLPPLLMEVLPKSIMLKIIYNSLLTQEYIAKPLFVD